MCESSTWKRRGHLQGALDGAFQDWQIVAGRKRTCRSASDEGERVASPVAAVIVGTRPEAIKLAPAVRALAAAGVCVDLISSGQHRELLRTALADFDLKPDLNLDLMQDAQELPELTARLLTGLSTALAERAPALVVVQGDTSTTLAAALAAFYARIPCAHVEAGLRTGNLKSPWPEEMNRRLVDRLCSRLYAPTEGARAALLSEGCDPASILVTGQTGVDAAQHMAATLGEAPPQELSQPLKNRPARLIYATGHRRESLRVGGIRAMAEALRKVAAAHEEVLALYAAHPNPAVRRELAGVAGHERLRIIEPVSYAASIWLLKHADLVVSDSGGIQEEAACFGIPVVVTREVTERPEGIAPGFLHIAGTSSDGIAAKIEELLARPSLREKLKSAPNPYGDGRAGERIARDIAEIVKTGSEP